ncbi:MAG TPA: ATP synthase F1 subunit epsilon [Tepidisphaeraceae bacterium]|jgi:F-type H+-transporting ATPase subunit epsilon
MAFQCTLVTPEQQVLDEQVSQAILPAHDGQIGILTGRSPLLVKLGIGTLRIDLATGGQKRFYFVDGGIAQMKDNKLTIVSTDAAPAGKIDVEAARAQYAEAAARHPTDAKTAKDREHQMARARAKQATAAAR